MMTMDEWRHGPVTVLQLVGRLDSRNASVLESRLMHLIAGKAPAVVLDLAGVDYLSGTCLRVLLLAAKRMDDAGCRMALCAPQPHVLDVLQISGLTRALHVYAGRAAALADFGEAG